MSPILIRALLILFALLVVASVTIGVLAQRSPEKDWSELKKRITHMVVDRHCLRAGHCHTASAVSYRLCGYQLSGVERVLNAYSHTPF